MLPKNSIDKRGGCGDCHDFSSETFYCTVPKKLVAESFSVSFFSGIEKIYALERFLMIFSSKVFSLTVPKTFVTEPFCVPEYFSCRKLLWIRLQERGIIMIFRQHFFVAQC